MRGGLRNSQEACGLEHREGERAGYKGGLERGWGRAGHCKNFGRWEASGVFREEEDIGGVP